MTGELSTSKRRIRKHLWILGAITLGMFAFCYALVPLYTTFCKATGLNGKTDGQAALILPKVDDSRTVSVELLADIGPKLKGKFVAKDDKVFLHPGELIHTEFHVENLTHKALTVQAIPSVSPGLAAQHIKKIECFCFTKQYLKPKESAVYPLTFTVDPALPTKFKNLTLSYTLFDISDT